MTQSRKAMHRIHTQFYRNWENIFSSAGNVVISTLCKSDADKIVLNKEQDFQKEPEPVENDHRFLYIVKLNGLYLS